METKKLELVIFSALFVVLSVLTFFVFQPFLRVLVLGIVLAVLFHPLYEKIVKDYHSDKKFVQSLVAFLMVVIALFFLIIPILFFGLQIFGQAQNFFSLTQVGQEQYIQTIQNNADTLVQYVVPGFSFNISDFLHNAVAFVSANIGSLISKTAFIVFDIFFLLFVFFFFVRDGQKMLDSFVSLSPFEKVQNKEILHSVYRTITSVIRGTLFVGLIRLVLITAAFYFLGIPNALLWGGVAGIVGAIPGLGTPFAVVPAFLYLLLYGSLFSAIGMAIFGGLLFFFVDNMLSAYFFGKGLDVPAPFVLFSILGGVLFFGPLGFIFGPIVLSLFISLVDIYKILVLKKTEQA